uniref:M superfamily MMSK group conopeptide Cp2-DD02 n=1 Tax=Conus capitaneus TaxID=89439 RepID=H2BKE3_CONCE|nr:M superfamily MMSK group conopeptide Cp2-DD02 [Conus capitaneus]
MMSKLGVLVTICLLLFPLTAFGDQPADHPAKRTQDRNSASLISSWVDNTNFCCCSHDCATICDDCF